MKGCLLVAGLWVAVGSAVMGLAYLPGWVTVALVAAVFVGYVGWGMHKSAREMRVTRHGMAILYGDQDPGPRPLPTLRPGDAEHLARWLEERAGREGPVA